jgi:hypothetical protein
LRSLPHITIACAAVWAGSRLSGYGASHSRHANNSHRMTTTAERSASLHTPIDYRLVALGSLLPDMVDRVIRAATKREWSRHQHLLGHSLLLNAPAVAAGIGLARRRRDPRLLGFAAASITHLAVDPVIRSPQTLLWPLFGAAFPESRGLNRTLTILSQIAAGIAVSAAIFGLQRRGRLNDFIAKGWL